MKCVKVQAWATHSKLPLLGCDFVKDAKDEEKVDAALWEPMAEGMPHAVSSVRRDAQRAVKGLFK